jgi:hypothetical protein
MGASKVPCWVMENFASQKPEPCELPDEWAAQSFMILVCNARLFCTTTDKITGCNTPCYGNLNQNY